MEGRSIADIGRMPVIELKHFVKSLNLPESRQPAARPLLNQLQIRLANLVELGIGHVDFSGSVRSLSRGERQRLSLAFALGTSLTSALYVLDEPTAGLHPADMGAVVRALKRLRERGNTVLVVDHSADLLRAADWLVELGPVAGQDGGRIVFQGTPAEILHVEGSITGDWLAGRRGHVEFARKRPTEQGWIRLAGARSKNLKDITVEFPLHVLCVVTGVSGSGKSALVQHALYPALRERLGGEAAAARTWTDLLTTAQVEHVEWVDHSPDIRSSRSNPVTYVKAFDSIRRVFAETADATTRNYGPGFFSFNVEGGRCEKCQGAGRLTVDMQFLPDLHMTCPDCNGKRYRREALAVHYRNRSIADVLEMTVREAIAFFRAQPAIQSRLQSLKEVGLDYLRLGQPASTLSGGEAQRLKLASFVQAKRAGRTLFLLDEPTAGLHVVDVLKLLDCFDALLDVGHSLIVVTHDLQLVRAADYVIELGPGAGPDGGQLVACGTPNEVTAHPESITGRFAHPTG
jgi:excinuclease ABC subunit A